MILNGGLSSFELYKLQNPVVDIWNYEGCANLPLATKITIDYLIISIVKCARILVVIINHKETLCRPYFGGNQPIGENMTGDYL